MPRRENPPTADAVSSQVSFLRRIEKRRGYRALLDSTIRLKRRPNPSGMVGRKLGQYRLLEHLASGGMGSVYRAIDETLDREVAIKLFDADFDDPERFRTEATTIARFNHPGIAT